MASAFHPSHCLWCRFFAICSGIVGAAVAAIHWFSKLLQQLVPFVVSYTRTKSRWTCL